MELWATIGLTVVAALLCVLLRKHQPEQGMAVGLVAGLLILAALIPRLKPLLQAVSEMTEVSSVSWEYAPLLIKGLGICLLTQLASDACMDAGEQGLATKAELAGKVALLLLSVPLFEQITRLATSLITGQETG